MRNAALQLRRVGKSEGTVNGLKMHKYVIKYRQATTSCNEPVCEQGYTEELFLFKLITYIIQIQGYFVQCGNKLFRVIQIIIAASEQIVRCDIKKISKTQYSCAVRIRFSGFIIGQSFLIYAGCASNVYLTKIAIFTQFTYSVRHSTIKAFFQCMV